jgi:5-methyltetrahydrofolate--homocysteine methyltransferase
VAARERLIEESTKEGKMPDIFEKISTELITGDIEGTVKRVKEGVDGGISAKEIIDKGLLMGMDTVGQRFKACEMFIPEVLRSAKCMHESMDVLKPLLSAGESAGIGTVLIGTVEGDLHDIGKNLVGMLLEGGGFNVIDLGINVKPQRFIEALKEHRPHILGMSALLTTTMTKMREVISSLEGAGIRDQVKVMVGGAPVTEDFARKIGADGFGSNAQLAVEKAKKLMKE